MWTQRKVEALKKQMELFGIREEDIEEQFILAPGKGGQKVNKTASAVHLHHVPSGIIIKCSQSRQQAENRLIARRMLVEKIEEIEQGKKSQAKQEADRIRKQKKRRSRRSQEKVLKEKRERSATKQLRQKPQDSDET